MKKKVSYIIFLLAMILFHYHSTGHFIWAILGIKAPFPLDPVEGWWAFLKGILPMLSLGLVFVAGIISKNNKTN